MHKSRFAGFIIDCKTDDLESAATFWGGALGMEVRAHRHVVPANGRAVT
jgi:hypothetical protein